MSELSFAGEPGAEQLPFDERHDEEQLTFDVARVEHRNDVRVLKPCRRLDLAQESFGT